MKNKLELHTKPKQPIQINRPLIITISIIVLTVLLLAIVGAFTTTKRIAAPSETALTKLAAEKPFVISPELNKLPENYSDVEAIKKFFPDSKSAELEALAQKFNELQNEYLYLKQQLAKKEPQTPEKPPEDPQLQQAKHSSLSFGNLNTGMDNMLGGTGEKRPFDTQDPKLVPTAEQEKLFKQQAQDEQKLAVMKGRDSPEDIYDMHNMVKPASPYQVLAGISIPATLITGINTSINGTVVAQVRQDIYDTVSGKYLLIPKGSRLIGEYSSYAISYGQSRIGIAINRLIRTDGTSILLGRFSNADLLGHAGVPGEVNNHWAQTIAAATLSTVFTVGAGIAGDRGTSGNQMYPRAKERALMGGAEGITQFAQNIANRALNIPPTITLPPGYQFNVLVKKDMVLTPITKRYSL